MTAKPHENVPGEIAEIAGQLQAAGLDDAAASVREAAEAARTDPERAEAVLREAAKALMAQMPAYSRQR
jgi:uncharacterized protein with von Willebrand factor type A (vWA) domain